MQAKAPNPVYLLLILKYYKYLLSPDSVRHCDNCWNVIVEKMDKNPVLMETVLVATLVNVLEFSISFIWSTFIIFSYLKVF